MSQAERDYLAAPGATVRLRAPLALHELAGSLWVEAEPVSQPSFHLTLDAGDSNPLPDGIEKRLAWTVEPERFRLEAPGHLEVITDVRSRDARGSLSSPLLHECPGLASRLCLETPVAILLSRDRHAALHAGAACLGRKAVVIRGASGAGKSTLVAALWKEGLRILGDESILVDRQEPSELAASVRELTILPDTRDLLGLRDCSTPTWSGGEWKFRIDLSARARPEDRFATHAATVLIGPRDPGPARLTSLVPAEFLKDFRQGAVKEEADPASLGGILEDWLKRPVFRLEGARDLAGAVRGVLQILQNA
ncbi:MAG: hypothetical protein IT186_27315 [Acidobacteria bacterium]|nr:hypothetical protein [Acidobacteriota bacterium]